MPQTPSWTLAGGALYFSGPWSGSVTYKEVGRQIAFVNGATAVTTPDGVSLAPNANRKIPAYSTTDATVAYDFGKFKLKFGVYNLFDHRAITTITGPTSKDLYTLQAGRQLQGTIEAKF